MYHCLAFIMLSSFVWFGYHYKTDRNFKFWKTAIIPIIVYIIGYGFRDGWGVDVPHYKDIYCHLRNTDIGLYAINYVLNQILGCDFTVALIIYSLILCLGIFSVTKGYKHEAIYILPLLWCLSAGSSTLVRSWISYGWLLIGISYLHRNDYKNFGIFSLFAIFTHLSSIILIPIILICNYRDWFTNKKTTLILYLIGTILLDKELLGETVLMPLANLLSNYISNERLDFYNSDASFWLSGIREVVVSQNESNELLNRIRMAIVNFIVIYFGFEAKNKYKHGYFWYNLAVLSCIFYNCTLGFELIERYIHFMRLSLAFIISFSIVKKCHKWLRRNKFVTFMIWLFVFVNLFFRVLFGAGILSNYSYYRYIWD